MRQIFIDYIQRAIQIRELSIPHPERIGSPDQYGKTLRDNFKKIGELSRKNREIISEVLLPMLQEPAALTREDMEELVAFAKKLINPGHLETLDPTIGWYIAEHLYQNVYQRVSKEGQLEILELYLRGCYNMCLKTRRIEAVSPMAEEFRKKGLGVFEKFEKYLDKDKLRSLPDEASRIRVIQNIRYGHCLYEGEHSDEASRKKDIEGLEELLDMEQDEEIRTLVPHMDWDLHRFRTLEYLALSVDYGNIRGFLPSQVEHIKKYADEWYRMWQSNPSHYSKLAPEGRVNLARLFNSYYACEVDTRTFKDQLISFYKETRPTDSYERDAIYGVFHAALAYMMCVDKNDLDGEDINALTMFYEGVMECALHSYEASEESYILEMVSLVLENFIEVPLVTFERMVLTCLAALHTPTYIHSLTVSFLTGSVCEAVIRLAPSMFIGFLGCEDEQDVLNHRDQIMDFAVQSSLLHDVGKLAVIDTIFIYERNLLDFEFDRFIKIHPQMGSYLLEKNVETEKYAPVALYHHQWHDDSAGYPGGEFPPPSMRILIDIVEFADCMDAATDSVGRSYNRGKNLGEFIEEVMRSTGSRYAPWLPRILEDEAVSEDLKNILSVRREENYKDTYWLLKDK